MDTFMAALFLLSVFILSFSRISDVDVWMHLSMGRLLWNLKHFPENEVFIYPSLELPYKYTSWLFATICYGIHKHFDASGLVFLKALVISSAFLILLRDSLRPTRNMILSVALLSVVFLLSQYRFALRPEIFSMLFLSFSIYALNTYISEHRKLIFSLPVIHFLWANMHSSVILMFVPFSAFLAGGLLQRYLQGKNVDLEYTPSTAQLKVIAVMFFLSLAAALLNPMHVEEFLYGGQVLSVGWYKQEIMEFRTPAGPERTLLMVMSGVTALSFLVKRKRLSLIHILLVLPVIFLAFSAIRFRVVFAIVAGPIVARNVSVFLKDKKWRSPLASRFFPLFTALWVVTYTSLVLAAVPPFARSGAGFGVGFDYTLMPRRAVEYMDRNEISGRVLNPFHFGQYIVWTGFPERSAFIDGRGYIPLELLEVPKRIRYDTSALDNVYRAYGFESLLLTYLDHPESTDARSSMDLSFSHPHWSLVYWDDISQVYLRRGGPYASLIRRDEYVHMKPEQTFTYFLSKVGDKDRRQHLKQELIRNIQETGSSRAYTFLGLLYYAQGEPEKAITALRQVNPVPLSDTRHIAYFYLGESHRMLGETEESISFYKKSLVLFESPRTLHRLGTLYMERNQIRTAVHYLEKALERDRNLAEVYPSLISSYRKLGLDKKALKVEKTYEELKKQDPAKRHFQKAMKAYFAKRYSEAIDEYSKVLAIDPLSPSTHTNLGRLYLEIGQLDRAQEHLTLALKTMPDHAKAHYNIALIYKKLGKKEEASKHFREFLRLEPTGNLAREAQRHLKQIP
jgi:tetratricopeptide (TPR) repeat protein